MNSAKHITPSSRTPNVDTYKNGIFKHLTQIIEENRGIDIPSRSIEHKRATMLLTNLYAMANNYLPAELVVKNCYSLIYLYVLHLKFSMKQDMNFVLHQSTINT